MISDKNVKITPDRSKKIYKPKDYRDHPKEITKGKE